MENKTNYNDLKKKLSRSLMWQYLQEKSEYGSNKSERGFQTICVDNAGMLADKLNLNTDLAQSLSICIGSYFPAYGEAGKNAIKEYLESKGINMTDNELGNAFVRYDMGESGIHCTEEFANYLNELFSENATSSDVPEVRIAAICHELMDCIKPVAEESHSKFNELETTVYRTLEKQCLDAGKPVQIKELPQLKNFKKFKKVNLSKLDKEIVFKELKNSEATNESIGNAVCEFIETGYIPSLENTDESEYE